MNVVAIIGCIVGIIGCVVGVCTFTSAQLTKAKQDGILISKIDQCVKGIDEIKSDMKEKNHDYDTTIDEHTKQITELQTQVKNIYKQINFAKV